MTFRFGIPICLLLAQSLAGQHAVLLQPNDAIRLVEGSALFTSRYAAHGCPSASAGVGESGDISLRMDDGCQDGVSTFFGEYSVNPRTGEVRDALDKIVVAATDPVVVEIWKEIDAALLIETECDCLVAHALKARTWRQLGNPTGEKITESPNGFFSVTLFPTSSKPGAPERLLRFRVDRRLYRVTEGRFSQEDLSQEMVWAQTLLRASKPPIELGAEETLAAAKDIPEVSAWLKADPCNGVRLDDDRAGQTYYSIELFHWCKDQQPGSAAGFDVNKRTGNILASTGLVIHTTRIPDADSKLKALSAQRAAIAARFQSQCPK